jgi:hypothetical protein
MEPIEKHRVRANVIAAILLAFMFIMMFTSAAQESAIMDELAHIPAGYSYVKLQDMRLNPEHPPLMKDLAGIPLLFFAVNFPTNIPYWTEYVNGQWDMGRVLLYDAGNDPDKILFWARLPMMLLTLLFGWLLYRWTRQQFGIRVALLTVFLFAFSPTLLAHGRYVTTDIAAAFGFFLGLSTFINFIENPTRKNLVIAGIGFGIAQLLKFSLVLLIPIYILLTLLWIFLDTKKEPKRWKPKKKFIARFTRASKLIGQVVAVGLIGVVLIWVVYAYHVWNYPKDRQINDAKAILSTYGNRLFVNGDIWLMQHDFTRPLGQYFLGVMMVNQRSLGGNDTYFNGQVGKTGWWQYFPVMYLLKEPFAFHLATLLALGVWLHEWLKKRSFALGDWMRNHFTETALIIFIILYWLYSIRLPLNIGVRHVLPTFPFIYILVSRKLMMWLRKVDTSNPKTVAAWLKDVWQLYIHALPKKLLVCLLFLWVAVYSIKSYPNFLSYYNELAGGPEQGYIYATDSNYDWGQDLKRLAAFVEDRGIEKIGLDYFGGGSPWYYLGDRQEGWNSSKGPYHGYFAVSATFRQGSWGTPVKGFTRDASASYDWLKPFQPIAKAGDSIFIYYLP